LTAFIRKLNAFARLSAEDESFVGRVVNQRQRQYQAHAEVAAEGERPRAVGIFLEGWGGRVSTLEDGRRQILGLYLPGDVCDLDILLAARRDDAITTITPARLAEVSPQGVEELMAAPPRVRQALAWERFMMAAIQREWAVSLGQRSAFERLAHLMCEVFTRLQLVGRTSDHECEFPLTQTELGEAMGLSTVHVNRVLQELRNANLIVLRDRTLTIPNFDALASAAMFDPGYLHLNREGRHLDANR
jgi:CRP-like cAMP-binding protein